MAITIKLLSFSTIIQLFMVSPNPQNPSLATFFINLLDPRDGDSVHCHYSARRKKRLQEKKETSTAKLASAC